MVGCGLWRRLASTSNSLCRRPAAQCCFPWSFMCSVNTKIGVLADRSRTCSSRLRVPCCPLHKDHLTPWHEPAAPPSACCKHTSSSKVLAVDQSTITKSASSSMCCADCGMWNREADPPHVSAPFAPADSIPAVHQACTPHAFTQCPSHAALAGSCCQLSPPQGLTFSGAKRTAHTKNPSVAESQSNHSHRCVQSSCLFVVACLPHSLPLLCGGAHGASCAFLLTWRCCCAVAVRKSKRFAR